MWFANGVIGTLYTMNHQAICVCEDCHSPCFFLPIYIQHNSFGGTFVMQNNATHTYLCKHTDKINLKH